MSPALHSLHKLLKAAAKRGDDEDDTPLLAGAALGGLGLAATAGLGLSNQTASKLRAFTDIPRDVSTDSGAAQFLKDYASKGHEAIGTRILGIPAWRFVHAARSIPGNPFPWRDSDRLHYENFAKSPEAALATRVGETVPEAKPIEPGQFSQADLAEAGRKTVDAHKGYSYLIDRGLNARRMAITAGLTLAGAAGLYGLYKLLSRKTRKP